MSRFILAVFLWMVVIAGCFCLHETFSAMKESKVAADNLDPKHFKFHECINFAERFQKAAEAHGSVEVPPGTWLIMGRRLLVPRRDRASDSP